jgi:hypothetical protein
MPLAKFDPVKRRQSWLEFHLQHSTRFEPEKAPLEARALKASLTLHGVIDAYFLGLADRVKPTLNAVADWMDGQSPPDRRRVVESYQTWRSGWESDYIWWRTLGLCRWLGRGEAGEAEFAKALGAEWNSWADASPAQAAEMHWDRQRNLGNCLAVALAANAPTVGLKLYEAANVMDPMDVDLPRLQFGEWACRHLAAGGKRDAEFVARGAEMLRASLLPFFLGSTEMDEAVLWLKAIYWDSGVVRTPEQAFAKAYDSMPGIDRPDFVPG